MSSEHPHTPIWGWQKARWIACFALALSFHGAGAAALIARWTEDNGPPPGVAVITIDLAPMAVSPTTTQTDMPPDQTLSKLQEEVLEPEPEQPPEKVEVPPDNALQPELAVMPPPKPVEKPKEKKKPKKLSLAAAPSAADREHDRAAAPTPGASGKTNANWRAQVVARIASLKKVPSDARSGGTVVVGFLVDRSGGVHNARVVRSSGSGSLDTTALSMVAGAAPLPPPPPEEPGARVPLEAPIRFTLH